MKDKRDSSLISIFYFFNFSFSYLFELIILIFEIKIKWSSKSKKGIEKYHLSMALQRFIMITFPNRWELEWFFWYLWVFFPYWPCLSWWFNSWFPLHYESVWTLKRSSYWAYWKNPPYCQQFPPRHHVSQNHYYLNICS